MNFSVPGVYERDGFWEVVNASPRESETDRCTEDEFANRFGISLHQSEQPALAGIAVNALNLTELRNDEVWHWVAFGLLGMLFLETFVANRTAV